MAQALCREARTQLPGQLIGRLVVVDVDDDDFSSADRFQHAWCDA
jgi:hypothetical protein